MIGKIEKLIKRTNKKRNRITLGVIIAFLLSLNVFAVEIENDKRTIEDFSEIQDIFKNEKVIKRKLSNGNDLEVRFVDSKIIISQRDEGIEKEIYGIFFKDLKKINNLELEDKVYQNIARALKNLKDNKEVIKVESIKELENNNFIFGMQIIEKDKLGVNNGIISFSDRGQEVQGIGINNGVIYSEVGQAIWDESLGINNGIILSNLHGQYSSLGMAINNGIIKSQNWGQVADESLGINNGIIDNEKEDGQHIIKGIGINLGTIKGEGVGQSLINNSTGINNSVIEKSVGQNINNSFGFNNNIIKSVARGQIIQGIGINTGRITTNTGIEGMAGIGQEVYEIGINSGMVNSENGIAQYLYGENFKGGIEINNGVLKGNEGQGIQSLGIAINNGIIIADRAYSATNGTGKFYKNGIALKREKTGKLILNDDYNSNVRKFIKKDLITNNKITKVSSKEIDKDDKIMGRNIFINNLGNNDDTKDNHFIINTNLTEKGYLDRDYRNTHITTAMAKDSVVKDSVIKVELENNEKSFTMDKSTIIGYFEKDGSLVDMTKNTNIILNNSVISAIGEEKINPIALKVNNGTDITLNNSVINGKIIFDGDDVENKGNSLNLNSKYNGKDKNTYIDGTQFMTSISDVEFKGKTDDIIVATIEKNNPIPEKDENTKGFISIGNINFGSGNDTLKINFEDYKSGHLNIGGIIDFGSDENKKSEEDKIEFSEVLDTTKDSLKSLVLLNNLLNQTKNLETLQLANKDNNIVIGENGISLEFYGTIKGGTGNDTFIVKGNGSDIYNIDGGEGNNSLKLNKIENQEKNIKDGYITINGKISNFSEIAINTNIKLGENAIFSNIYNNSLNLNNNNLILDINKNKKNDEGSIIGNALYDKNENINFENMNKIVFDVSKLNKNENILVNNTSIKENKDKITTNSYIYDVKIDEKGNVKVEIKENLPLPPKPSEPEIPMKPIEPSKPIIKPTPIEPSKPVIKPTPIVPAVPSEKPPVDSNTKYEIVPNYDYLNKIYQSIISADRNAMNDTTLDTGKTERESIMAQLEFYGKIFNSTPYAYSNKVSKKTLMAITDEILYSEIKSKENEWIFGGKIIGQNSDNKNEFYGRTLHEVDGGKSEVKVDSNISGAYVYAEYGLKSNASLGFVVGGTKSSTDISGNSKLKGNSISIFSYAKKDINNLQLKAGIGYQHSFYDSTRTVSNAYQSMSVNKEYEDNSFNMFGGIRYSYSLGREIYVEPYFNMIFSYIKQEGINEENNQSLTMSVKKKSFNSLDTETGIDLVKKLNLSKGELKLKVGTSLMYAIDGYENEYLTGKINGATKDFEILSAERDKTRAKLKTSMEYELENGVSYSVNGEYITSSKNKDYKVGIGIGYKF